MRLAAYAVVLHTCCTAVHSYIFEGYTCKLDETKALHVVVFNKRGSCRIAKNENNKGKSFRMVWGIGGKVKIGKKNQAFKI